mgnify:FL=1
MTEFRRLRQLAGHTQKEAARYIYSSERTIRAIEAGEEDKMRTELYRYKLRAHGVGEGKA